MLSSNSKNYLHSDKILLGDTHELKCLNDISWTPRTSSDLGGNIYFDSFDLNIFIRTSFYRVLE